MARIRPEFFNEFHDEFGLPDETEFEENGDDICEVNVAEVEELMRDEGVGDA